jgi:hypothetical protein
MFKLISFFLLMISILIVKPSFGQDEDFQGGLEKRTYAKAYDQEGYFCKYWDDCQDDGPCDGLYGLDILVKDKIYTFTVDEEFDKKLIDQLIELAEGSPIDFDFKVRYLFMDGEPLYPTPSLTRVEITGIPTVNPCPE